MYPDTAEKSDERDRILKNRKKIALKMLRDGKVSLSLAAKLAGLSVEEMTEEAIKHGIKPFDAQDDMRKLIRKLKNSSISNSTVSG
jgi:predicted HTH domain antitoxin